MPSAAFEDEYLHPDIYQQAAAYAFHECQNHPFIDGNKRTALAAALVFLALNGTELDDRKEELYELMRDVARGMRTKAEIAAAFKKLRDRSRRR